MSVIAEKVKEKQSMLDINQQQADFYNKPKKNAISSIWSWGRGKLLRSVRLSIGVSDDVYRLHREWLADLSGKKVLDLGCFAGNVLSLEIAKKAGYYLGIDLSKRGISELKAKLESEGVINGQAVVVDFLSDDFDQYGQFDVIYIYGAMHHFQHFDVLLNRLNEVLMPNGRIITYDPTETSPLIKFIRSVYRPFQSDAAWEWPFNRDTYKSIQKVFVVEHVQGFLGRSKAAVMLAFLPLSANWKRKKSQEWHAYDLANANSFGPALESCMHVAMCLRKKL